MISGNSQSILHRQSMELLTDGWGKTLVVAPHPDDESLGCGGTIALLRRAGIPVAVLFTSDGSMSHPASKQYPATSLIALRESEALAALQVLGVEQAAVHFMRLKDSQLPGIEANGFDIAVESFERLLQLIQPEIILLPWRRDPHKDHRATWQIADAALQQFQKPVRRLEYLIWLWERGEADEYPLPGEALIWQIDIEAVKPLKKRAIGQHLSQTTRLIVDDPDGFILSQEVLAHFDRDYELFIEMKR